MNDLKWSPAEKKTARRAYGVALEATLAKTMTEFKAKAAAATTPSEMWAVEDYLRQQRRELSSMIDPHQARGGRRRSWNHARYWVIFPRWADDARRRQVEASSLPSLAPHLSSTQSLTL